jgi:hypothetical protein
MARIPAERPMATPHARHKRCHHRNMSAIYLVVPAPGPQARFAEILGGAKALHDMSKSGRCWSVGHLAECSAVMKKDS